MKGQTMLIAEARVETHRSSRYLVQLCRHFNHKAQAQPDLQARVEWSEDRGVASFGWGRCTLHADPGVLSLRAEAPDEDGLRQVERLVSNHLERFGRRDQLTLTWHHPDREPPGQAPDDTRGDTDGGSVALPRHWP